MEELLYPPPLAVTHLLPFSSLFSPVSPISSALSPLNSILYPLTKYIYCQLVPGPTETYERNVTFSTHSSLSQTILNDDFLCAFIHITSA